MFDLAVIQARTLEIFYTVLDWLQSPLFWAQIGGIIAAWLIARALTKALRKRVPFLHTQPQEG